MSTLFSPHVLHRHKPISACGGPLPCACVGLGSPPAPVLPWIVNVAPRVPPLGGSAPCGGVPGCQASAFPWIANEARRVRPICSDLLPPPTSVSKISSCARLKAGSSHRASDYTKDQTASAVFVPNSSFSSLEEVASVCHELHIPMQVFKSVAVTSAAIKLVGNSINTIDSAKVAVTNIAINLARVTPI